MIESGRLAEFIIELVGMVNSEKEENSLWEFFLHRVYDKSYYEFVDEVKRGADQEPVDFQAAVRESYEILSGFVPEQG